VNGRGNFAQTNLRAHGQDKLVQKIARMRSNDGRAKNFVGTSHSQNFGETAVFTFHYRVGGALLVLRVTVFLVMVIWTIDKFVRPWGIE
jgi:hypothetical protein